MGKHEGWVAAGFHAFVGAGEGYNGRGLIYSGLGAYSGATEVKQASMTL